MDRFGANIAFLRKTLGWSQEDLAKRLDVKRTTISNYEMGISMPPYKTLKKISDLFGVDIHGLTAEDLSNPEGKTDQSKKYYSLVRKVDSFEADVKMRKDSLQNTPISTKRELEEPILKEKLSLLKEKLSISEFNEIMDSGDADKHIQELVNEIERLKAKLHSLESILSFINRVYGDKDSSRRKDSDVFIKSDSFNE